MSKTALSGTLLNEQVHVSLTEICQACSCRTQWVVDLVQEGILEPHGHQHSDWQFPGSSISRARSARRLQRDLGINLAGVALALGLLEEVETLRCRIRSGESIGAGERNI